MSQQAPGLTPLVSYVRQTLGYRRDGGVIGNEQHTYGYHLGKDRIFNQAGMGWDDYSVQTKRDKNGLSDYACAIDIGNDWDKHADWLQWLVTSCRQGKFPDVREIIGTHDGVNVVGWDHLAGWVTEPDRGDETHLWHTHISFYRDSATTSQVQILKRYLEPPQAQPVKASPAPGPVVRTVDRWEAAPVRAAIGPKRFMPWWLNMYYMAGVAAVGVTAWVLRRRMELADEDS